MAILSRFLTGSAALLELLTTSRLHLVRSTGSSAFIHHNSHHQFHFSNPGNKMPRRSSRSTAIAASAKINRTYDIENEALGKDETKKTSRLKGSTETNHQDDSAVEKKASSNLAAADATLAATADRAKTSPAKKKTPKKRVSKGASKRSNDSEDETKPPKKKPKAADHQRWTERTPLTRHWDPVAAAETGSYTFSVISWNIAGLRTFIKKNPDALSNLATKYDADVICLQETKLQGENLDDPNLKLREYFDEKLEGYECHFSCSVEKKGYSGTAMFIRKYSDKGNSQKGKKQATLGAFFGKTADKPSSKSEESTSNNSVIPISNLHPVTVSTELGIPEHDGEGRTIIAEFPLFYLTNVYVPNSGMKLDRLSYRTTQWDKAFVTKMQQLEKHGGKPIVWLGDLNVAFDEKDTWNEGAKHLVKSAGTTPEERASFAEQLSAGFIDAFRHLHPDGKGHYSYWSQRAGNREPNKGLRLDYFICSKALMLGECENKAIVRDSYMIHDQLGSDHCPIVLEIEIKN